MGRAIRLENATGELQNVAQEEDRTAAKVLVIAAAEFEPGVRDAKGRLGTFNRDGTSSIGLLLGADHGAVQK